MSLLSSSITERDETTPRPWHPAEELLCGGANIEAWQGPIPVRVATVWDIPDAELILRAVNAHDDLIAVLAELVDEFGSTIEQYHKIGPDWTHKDGTEVFNVSSILDREPLVDRARAALAKAVSP